MQQTLLIIGILVIFVSEASAVVRYGNFIPDIGSNHYLLEEQLKECHLNLLNPRIIGLDGKIDRSWRFIGKAKHFSFVSKYYVQGVGRIKRFSYMHRIIRKKFKELEAARKQYEYNKHLKEQSSS